MVGRERIAIPGKRSGFPPRPKAGTVKRRNAFVNLTAPERVEFLNRNGSPEAFEIDFNGSIRLDLSLPNQSPDREHRLLLLFVIRILTRLLTL